MTKLFSFIFFLTVLFSLPASAQTDPLNIESFEKITQMITKEAAQEAIKLALANITAAQCNDGKSCSAATKEEYDNPPI